MPNEINLNSVPKLYKDTYVGKINDCIFIYTPAQENGIVVLRKGLVELFSFIDGKQSLKQIHKKYASFATLNQLWPRREAWSLARSGSVQRKAR